VRPRRIASRSVQPGRHNRDRARRAPQEICLPALGEMHEKNTIPVSSGPGVLLCFFFMQGADAIARPRDNLVLHRVIAKDRPRVPCASTQPLRRIGLGRQEGELLRIRGALEDSVDPPEFPLEVMPEGCRGNNEQEFRWVTPARGSPLVRNGHVEVQLDGGMRRRACGPIRRNRQILPSPLHRVVQPEKAVGFAESHAWLVRISFSRSQFFVISLTSRHASTSSGGTSSREAGNASVSRLGLGRDILWFRRSGRIKHRAR
jgi:hypothetical protein